MKMNETGWKKKAPSSKMRMGEEEIDKKKVERERKRKRDAKTAKVNLNDFSKRIHLLVNGIGFHHADLI